MSARRTGEDETTGIWRKYEAGRDHHNGEGMYRRVERCHRFYEGDQWAGIKAGGEELPVLNLAEGCMSMCAHILKNCAAGKLTRPKEILYN